MQDKYLYKIRCRRCGIDYLEVVFPEDVSAGQAVAECPRCRFNQYITSLEEPAGKVLSLEEVDKLDEELNYLKTELDRCENERFEQMKDNISEDNDRRLVVDKIKDDEVEEGELAEPYEPKILKTTFYERFLNGISTGHIKYYVVESEEEEEEVQAKIITKLAADNYERADTEEIMDINDLDNINRLNMDIKTFQRIISVF